MKILQVHNYYQISGGEDTVVLNEKKLLEEHGYTVIQYSRSNSEIKEFSWIQKILLPFATIFNPKTYKDIRNIIKKEKVDIVHVHNTLNLISPSVYYAAVSCGIPVVQTVHNFRLLCPAATLYRDGHICEDCIQKGLLCSVKHKCYRNSRAETFICAFSTWLHRLSGIYRCVNYICLTDFNKQKLCELKQIKSSQIYIKPNCAIKKRVECIPAAERKETFVYFGRIDKLKGIEVLIDAWELLGEKAPQLVICGKGPLENWCKREIQNRALKNVEYLGFVTNEMAIELVACSKAVILPTQWYEGFPMTIVEAYSVGTPIIGSNIGNVGSLIKEGVTGYHIQFNSAESIAYIVQNGNFNLYYSTYEYYEKYYSTEKNYIILKEIYETLSRMDKR